MNFSPSPAGLPSTKPYLVRAIWEWCNDNAFTPYLMVEADASCRIPQKFIKDGQIVLNISAESTQGLQIANESIDFQTRFGGVLHELYIPMARIAAIYARENGVGMAFEVEETPVQDALPPLDETPPPPDKTPDPPAPSGRPRLQRVK
jgi:stringent starvation protein B